MPNHPCRQRPGTTRRAAIPYRYPMKRSRTRYDALASVCTAIAGAVLALSGCDAAEPIVLHPAPQLLTPDRSIFYSCEEIRFAWDLPEDAEGTEFTVLTLDGFFDPGRHQALFDTTGADGGFFGGEEPQQVYIMRFDLGAEPEEELYLGYRVRTVGPAGTSVWSPVQSLRIEPCASLTPLTVEVDIVYAFEAERGRGEHFAFFEHSGTVTSEPIDFDAAVVAQGYAPAQVRVIQPRAGFVEHLGPASDEGDPFERVALGLVDRTDVGAAYPADVLADTYAVATGREAELTFYPYGGHYMNLTEPLRAAPRLRMAYFLNPAAPVGITHRLRVAMAFEVLVEEA